jgi:3',5'-cyclic-AMP phosphodiesterase
VARVLVLSDLHLTTDPRRRVRGADSHAGVQAALEHARAEGPFARVVLTGDLAQEPRRETYDALRALLGDDAERALIVPGNHDRLGPLGDAFPGCVDRAAGCVGFAADLEGWRLVGVDTHWPGRVRGRIGPRLDWLARALGDRGRPAVLFLHHPPLPVGTTWLDWTRLLDAAALEALLARAGNVRLVVHGHVHMPSEGSLAGIRVIGVPSTAYQFVPGSWLPRRGRALPGYRILELGEGSCEAEVRYVDPDRGAR